VKNIVLGVTGSIAAYKAAEIVSLFDKNGHKTHIIMTQNARKFIAPLTFQTLARTKVYTDMFEEYVFEDVRHITLARDADVLLVAPASANILGKMANGIADDLLSTVLMAAWEKPIILCPAMNTAMYRNPVTRGNMEKLKALGARFVEPRESRLACGDVGVGALADVNEIVDAVNRVLEGR
jgi:phosphopantothenoylcysteine decarboxylase/phosphopantothenoylcysteine decarboxylase/phosphopantothenate--cysteine ligase